MKPTDIPAQEVICQAEVDINACSPHQVATDLEDTICYLKLHNLYGGLTDAVQCRAVEYAEAAKYTELALLMALEKVLKKRLAEDTEET